MPQGVFMLQVISNITQCIYLTQGIFTRHDKRLIYLLQDFLLWQTGDLYATRHTYTP